MRIEQVKNLSPVERFLYWCRERHNIYLRRRAGMPKPWTDDEVFRTTFFTNPYRENDKVTVWFRENIRDPLRNSPAVLLATLIFRWFNYIPTAKVLIEEGRRYDCRFGFLTYWRPGEVSRVLKQRQGRGEQIFTGAFMIGGGQGDGGSKIDAVVRRITNVWNDREVILKAAQHWGECGLETAHQCFTRYEGIGGFMAYEIVCDLRYTYLLKKASDKLTWCNPGPGAIRGLYRVLERPFPKGNNSRSPPLPADWTAQTQRLLNILNKRLSRMPAFEMREVEHSLCEFDKYERVLWGDGRAKRRFCGV